MALFKVLQPIEHDGRKLKIGDEVSIAEGAESLLKLGVVEAIPSKTPPKAAPESLPTK